MNELEEREKKLKAYKNVGDKSGLTKRREKETEDGSEKRTERELGQEK